MPAHIPESDARQLFEQNHEHSWKGLLGVVESHRNQTGGIANNVVLMLIPTIKKLESSGQPYPSTFQDFVRVIDQTMAKEFAT